MEKAKENIIKIIYQNSHDTGNGMEIDFDKIHHILDLLEEDKIKFAQYHVQQALEAAINNTHSYLQDEIIGSYPLTNIK